MNFQTHLLILSGCCTYTGDVDILEFQCVSWASRVFSEKGHFDCNGDALQTGRAVDPLTGVTFQAVCFIDDLWHTVQVEVLPVIGAGEFMFIYTTFQCLSDYIFCNLMPISTNTDRQILNCCKMYTIACMHPL